MAAEETTTAQLPGLLTGRQLVASVLPVTERTLFTYRAEGMPHVKLPGRVLYDPADVVAWVKSRYGVSGQVREANV